MRRLVCFTLGFTAACALSAYNFQGKLAMICTLAALVLGILCRIPGEDSFAFRRIAIGLFGCGLGFFWYSVYSSHYLAFPERMDGTSRQLTVRAVDYTRETERGSSLDGKVTIREQEYRIRIYLDGVREVEPGDLVTGEFRLKSTTAQMEESTYHPGAGIFLLGYQNGDITLEKGIPELSDKPVILRRTISDTLRTCLPEPAFPFVQALLLGDTSGINYELDTDLKISGIRHVVAVSGLHVSILFALISTVTLKRRFLTVLLGLPALAVFAAVAGFSPSVVRACIMSALMLLATLFNREYDPMTALAFAIQGMLLANPMAVTSVSLQLSAASVAGIFLFSRDVRTWLLFQLETENQTKLDRKFASWFSSSVSVSLSAMVLTVPLSSVYFGTISLIGVLTNLMTLWVISGIFYGAMAVCMLFPFAPAAAVTVGKLVSCPVGYILFVVRVLGNAPGAAVYTVSPYITAWLVFVYLLLGIFLLCKYRFPWLLGCCVTLGFCAALLASWSEAGASDVRFTMLDVGQGQCLIFQSEGKTYLIDCGGDSDEAVADLAAQTLLSQGITKLDGVILTHTDRDHSGGISNLLTQLETDLLILPEDGAALASATQGAVVYATENLELAWGNSKIRIFPPNFHGNSNEMSLCLLLDTEKCDILITGDRNGFGERSLLRNADIPQVDVLVAGHHGSKNSTCEELLEAVRPEVVCISVDQDNAYGHPAAEVLTRLRKYGCTVYRTDKHGTILIRR